GTSRKDAKEEERKVRATTKSLRSSVLHDRKSLAHPVCLSGIFFAPLRPWLTNPWRRLLCVRLSSYCPFTSYPASLPFLRQSFCQASRACLTVALPEKRSAICLL